ncbi:MAG: hypothetical protein ACLPUO_26490 [Streptosporangiaceae bacterium]
MLFEVPVKIVNVCPAVVVTVVSVAGGGGVAGRGATAPLSVAERSRRYRERKKAASRQARGYSWPALEESNLVSMRHGAHSRLMGPEASGILAEVEAMPSLPPFIRDPSYAYQLETWAESEAMARRARRWIAGLPDEVAFTSAKAGSAAPAEVARRIEAHAASMRAAALLTPASRARLAAALREPERDLARELALEELRQAGEPA